MKVNYDNIADSMYILYQDKKVVFSKDNGDGNIFDFDEFGGLVGVEIIGVKSILRQTKQKDLEMILA